MLLSNRSLSVLGNTSFLNIFIVLLVLTLFLPACRVKSGCPVNQYTNKMEKAKKGGKSGLFNKSTTKKMKH